MSVTTLLRGSSRNCLLSTVLNRQVVASKCILLYVQVFVADLFSTFAVFNLATHSLLSLEHKVGIMKISDLASLFEKNSLNEEE